MISIGSDRTASLPCAARVPLDADGVSVFASGIRTGANTAARGSVNTPSQACRRQVNNKPGYTPGRAATSVTRTPGSLVSATIRSFSSTD
jgi:hypothetical protein